MRVIGITGGVASGKSTVAALFGRLGAEVLDADRAGHDALRLPSVIAAAKERWGDRIVGPDGQINRTKLARIVFASGRQADDERKYLEQLTHPVIAESLRQRLQAFEKAGARAVVLDAALLTEAGWNRFCHKTVFVDTPREERLSRALSRGWTRGEFDAREQAQEALEKKREQADVVIDNSGSPERTQAEVDRFWASLF